MMLIAGHQQPVARDVEGTIGAFLVRQQPVPDHDVRTILEHRRQQLANVRGRIGAVSVDHDVQVGVDVAEHRRHHEALAPKFLRGDLGPAARAPEEVSSEELLSYTQTAATLSHGSRRKTLILAAYEAPC